MVFLTFFPLLLALLPTAVVPIICSIVVYCLFCAHLCFFLKNSPPLSPKRLRNMKLGCFLPGAVVGLFLCVVFFAKWYYSSTVRAIAGLLHIPTAAFLGAVSLLLYAAIVYSAAVITDYTVSQADFRKSVCVWLSTPCRNTKAACMSATLTVLVIIYAQRTLSLWTTSDTYWISCILNGLYSSDNYIAFVNPILPRIVSAIDRLLPDADGMALLEETLAVIGFWCVFYLLAKIRSRKAVALTALFIIALNYQLNLLHLPFTSFTAELAVLGFFLIFSYMQKKSGVAMAVVGTVLLFFSVLWRYEALLLICPFMLLILVSELAVSGTKRREVLLRIVLLMLPAVVICTSCIAIKYSTDHSDRYADGIAYNAARSRLFDYQHLPWEDVSDSLEAIGVSENDYQAMPSMILADTGVVNTEYMETIHRLSQAESKTKADWFLSSGLWNLWRAITESPIFLSQTVVILILLCMMILNKQPLLQILTCLCACLGTVLIFAYYTYTGHLVHYMIQSVFFGIFLTFLCAFTGPRSYIIQTRGMNVLLGFVLSLLIVNYASHSHVYLSNIGASLTAKQASVVDLVRLDDSDKTIYVWGVGEYNQAVLSSNDQCSHKLLSEEFLAHNIMDGEWHYGQPYFTDYMHRIGLENPMQALLYRDHTYYIAKDVRCRMVLKFLQEHYDSEACAEYIGSVSSIPVWKFSLST